MSVPVWQPGTLYQPNALVIPQTAPPVIPSEMENGNFEAGDTGWDKGTGWAIISGVGFDGTHVGNYATGFNGEAALVNDNLVPVTPGQQITLTGKVNNTGNTAATGGAAVMLFWYDSGMALISQSGAPNQSGGGDNWYTSTITAAAPAGAAFAAGGAFAYRNSGPHNIYVDALSWDYVAQNAPDGLIFKAVQADAAFSASTEPVWPTTLGVTVIDGGVTWEAVLTTRVVWEASPILVSGSYEPVFPTIVGALVADNTIGWKAISRRIEDPNCPNTAVVVIAASKVFSGDDDIMAFSATIKPLDWTTPDDAGYLPFGLQTYGSQPISAAGLYRSNLVISNPLGMQIWQVDEDPANMAFLDAVPITCTFPRTMQPAGNLLAFLNAKGIRGITVAPNSNNIRADAVGDAIDELVRAKVVDGTYTPIGLFWPFVSQYWCIFGPEAFVLTINGTSRRSWSRYTFPDAITDWTIQGDDLILRAGTKVWRMESELTGDDVQDPEAAFAVEDLGSYTGYNALNDPQIGSVTSTTLSSHSMLMATIFDGEGFEFSIVVSNIPFASAPTAFTSIRVYAEDGTLFTTLETEAAIVENMGTQTVDSVEYPDCVKYTWGADDNFLSGETAFSISFDGFTAEEGGEPIEGVVWFPYLDLGSMGVTKMMDSFDVVAIAPEGVSVSFGYNQRDITMRTADFEISGDTLPAMTVPMPISGPSFDMKLTFATGQRWQFNAACLYIQDRRVTS